MFKKLIPKHGKQTLVSAALAAAHFQRGFRTTAKGDTPAMIMVKIGDKKIRFTHEEMRGINALLTYLVVRGVDADLRATPQDRFYQPWVRGASDLPSFLKGASEDKISSWAENYNNSFETVVNDFEGIMTTS